MPNMTFGNLTFNQEEHILANNEGIRRRLALTVDPALVQPDSVSNKVVRPGSILYRLAGGGGRLNVRAKLETAIAASTTTALELGTQGIQYASEMAQFFNDGDILKVLRPYSFMTLSGTWDTDDTLTLTVDGQAVTYTPGSATLATGAANTAAAINADPYHGKLVEAIAADDVIYLFSKTLRTYSLAATATTTGNGDVTANDATLVGNVTIGTVDANGVNVAAGTVTLNAAATISLPADAPIGLSDGTPYSLVISPFNLAEGETDISGIMSGSIYGQRLPYWDEDIASHLPEITFA